MSGVFKVSVIIPVYNAAKYVTKAVESALAEEEVGEVLLIEDGSPDNALLICQQLANKHDKVRLLQHADKKNHGAAASRNLGILNATLSYIAFLDADDYFLPGRFKIDLNTFSNNETIDGIYHAVAPVSLNGAGDDKMLQKKRSIMTMSGPFSSDVLFENLAPIGYGGFFSLNGLTVKRNVFDKTGLMNSKLRLSQDTDICIKLAALCKLVPGSIVEPLAMYGVHDLNRSHDLKKITSNRPYLFYTLYVWSKEKKLTRNRKFLLWQRFYEFNNIVHKLNRKQQIALLFQELINNPEIIRSRFFRKQLPLIHRFF